ncbi:MAG: hypothetical protein WDM89_16090 [Rhizomicrobium sp.]
MMLLAIMLLSAAVAGWLVLADAPEAVRSLARFACVLYAALAAAECLNPSLMEAVTLIVAAVAPAFLALAMRASMSTPVSETLAAVILALCTAAGIFAAVTGIAAFAFAPLTVSVLAIMSTGSVRFREHSMPSLQAMASALALLAGAAAFLMNAGGAQMAFLLLHATGLFGMTLAIAPRSDAVVEQAGQSHLCRTAIRKLR